MKIAILTSGILPVPAVQGGAVENLTDFYLEYNDLHQLHDITIYSVWHPDVEKHPALHSKVNHYHYIDVNSFFAKIRKRIFHWKHDHEEYYHYTIEYFLQEAIKDIRKKQYDIILLENRPGFALKLRNVTKAKLVYHLHNEKLTKQIPNYQEIYDAATSIITVSDYIKSCVKMINANDTKTKTVYNGIDLTCFTRGKRPSIERKHLGLSDDDFVMVFSGRINQEKGIAELIDAMLILNDLPKTKLLIIGSTFFGNAEDEDDFVHYLKEKAQRIKERILFTGFVPYNKMPDYLQIADIAVVPSIWDDPFPTTILEAQAMGLPIITTNRGGIPEEVTTENALIIPTGQDFVHQLADAIRHLYIDSEKRIIMSKASLSRSVYFSKERYAKDFFKILESIKTL